MCLMKLMNNPKKDEFGRYYLKVMTPGTEVIDHIVLNPDGSVRGKNFGTGLYMTFDRYTDDLILTEEIDMGGQ